MLTLGTTTNDRYCGDCPHRYAKVHRCHAFNVNLGLGPEGALRTLACLRDHAPLSTPITITEDAR